MVHRCTRALRRRALLGLAPACVLVLLVSGFPTSVGSTVYAAGSPAPVSTAVGPLASSGTETLSVLNHTINNLSNFWGAGITPSVTLQNASAESSGTPITWYVWPAGKIADTYNMTTGQIWTDGYPTTEPANESQFVTWCKSVACHAIFTVPGEVDSPALGAYEVWYTEQVLDFYPAYWEVGNEPYGWTHFGKPWTQWNATDNLGVTPTQYAQVLQAYITAMRAVDPTARFIGLPGVGAGTKPDGPWINATVSLNGPNLSAIAIHDYPAERGPATGGSVGQFYATLTESKSYMVSRISTDEQDVRAACPSCGPIPFFVDEFGAGTGVTGPWQPYMQTYYQVPFVAAELVMMSELNVTNADIFSLRSGYNGSLYNATGIPLPVDSLYDQILPNYGSLVLQTTLSGTSKSFFAGAALAPDSDALTVLAVNTNTTASFTLNVTGPMMPRDGSYAIWRANNSTTSTAGAFSQTLAVQSSPSWVVPPLGVILVSVCRANASAGARGSNYAVSFCEEGLPSVHSWSVTVGSTTLTTSGDVLEFDEPNGTYGYSITPIAGWRTSPLTGSITVAGGPADVIVPYTVVTFPVTFVVHGLPAGEPWSVTIGSVKSTTSASSLPLVEPNGTYSYLVGPESGWTLPHFRGNFTVAAQPVTVWLNWTQVIYNVTFHETGLLAGTSWSVTLNGSTGTSMVTTIHFALPNGTYSYTVHPVTGYTPNVLSGSVQVKGDTPFVPITWAPSHSVFTVWFNATGLGSGANWSVTFNGTTQQGTSRSFAFYEPNGTYPFLLASAGWATAHYAGNETVNGTYRAVSVPWTQVTYTVTFNETGLPYPTNWSVTVLGSTQTTYGPQLSFQAPNGTTPYRAFGATGYATTYGGNFTVNATPQFVTVHWRSFVSVVTFNETGLPVQGTNWTVNVTGHALLFQWTADGSTSSSYPNGTYNYTYVTGDANYGPLVANGSFVVTGHPASVVLAFVPYYAVTFNETGLPSATNWSVTLGTSFAYSNATNLTVRVPDGSYGYVVTDVPDYSVTPESGTVTVAGAGSYLTLAFALLPNPEFPVYFNETGLPAGTHWSVAFGGTIQSASGPGIVFLATNGSYSFTVGAVSEYGSTPSSGSVRVDGRWAAQSVAFTYTGVRAFALNFTETGLPTGTQWSVTVGGGTASSTGPTVSFIENTGTYPYTVGAVADWTATPAGGDATVSGAATVVPIVFTPQLWAVTFNETGLPRATNWSVTLGTSTIAGTTGTLAFLVPAGSYGYVVGGVPGFAPSPATGALDVTGAEYVNISWSVRLYSVVVSETGLPSGTSWTVVVDDVSHDVTTGQLTLQLGNGSHTFRVTPPNGFAASPATGSISVAGGSTQEKITFTVATTTGTPGGGGGPTSLDTIGVVAVVGILAVGLVLWAWTRRRNPPAGTSPREEGSPSVHTTGDLPP